MKLFFSFLVLCMCLCSCSTKSQIQNTDLIIEQYLVKLKTGIKANYVKSRFDQYNLMKYELVDEIQNEWSFLYNIQEEDSERLFIQLSADQNIVSVEVVGKNYSRTPEEERKGFQKKIETSKY